MLSTEPRYYFPVAESISQSVLDLVQKLGCFVSRRIPVMTMKVIRNLMMIGLLAYLVMYRAYTGERKWGTFPFSFHSDLTYPHLESVHKLNKTQQIVKQSESHLEVGCLI